MWNLHYTPSVKESTKLDPTNVDYHNLFVKHLPTDLTTGQLKYLFHTFGEIVETKIMINRLTGESLGYGFVRFSNSNESKIAKDVMNGYQVGNKRLYITFAHRIHSHQRNHKVTRNLYIAGIPEGFDERKLREMFEKYGDILNVKIWRDGGTGKSRCVGFILFKEQNDATEAFEDMNGINIERRKITIRYAKMPRNRKTPGKTSPNTKIPNTPLTPEFLNTPKKKNSLKKKKRAALSAGSSSKRRGRPRRTSSPLLHRPSRPSPLFPIFVGRMNGEEKTPEPKSGKKAFSLDKNFIGPYSHRKVARRSSKPSRKEKESFFSRNTLLLDSNNKPRSKARSLDDRDRSEFRKMRSRSIFTPLRPSFFGGGPSSMVGIPGDPTNIEKDNRHREGESSVSTKNHRVIKKKMKTSKSHSNIRNSANSLSPSRSPSSRIPKPNHSTNNSSSTKSTSPRKKKSKKKSLKKKRKSEPLQPNFVVIDHESEEESSKN